MAFFYSLAQKNTREANEQKQDQSNFSTETVAIAGKKKLPAASYSSSLVLAKDNEVVS